MTPKTHEQHDHTHKTGCGHTAVKHNGHTDYLHDGHMHNVQGDQVNEHRIEVSKANPTDCTPTHECGSHEKNHVHGANCGHEQVPHGDHTDYLVNNHLHHQHGNHCDDHGKVEVTRAA